MKRTGVQSLQKSLDDELGAQIEPLDLIDDFRFEVFFDGGHWKVQSPESRAQSQQEARHVSSLWTLDSALEDISELSAAGASPRLIQ